MDNVLYGQSAINRMPDNPRESVEPEGDMTPDDAREFMSQLPYYMCDRMRQMETSKFEHPQDARTLSLDEKAKQYYGTDVFQLFSGIEAALREWDKSGHDVQELKEEYGGVFVEGVKIGERLAVYQGSDFTFTDTSESESDDSESSKFTFSA